MIDVTKHGIVGDGVTDNTVAINELLKSLNGGEIYFPPGNYVTGSVRLYSNTTVHIASGATILGSENRANYPMLDETVIDQYNRKGHAALFYAIKAENIRLEGGGTIDGRGYNWWQERDSEVRPRLFQPILCNKVTLRDLTLCNSPMWTVNPVCCHNVTIDNISVINPYDSPNTDGINPESCSGVRISNCLVDVGDDCVTIKSGTENDILQKQYPCEDIVISNCTMLHGHGGVVVGSEMSGGVRNVCVTNCVFKGTERGVRFKTTRERGGFIKNIMVSNIVMENVLCAVTANEFYGGIHEKNADIIFDTEKRPVTSGTPEFESIFINNVLCKGVKGAGIYMLGLPEKKITGISLSNVDIIVEGSEEGIEPVSNPYVPRVSGEGIYMENADGISMSNVNVKSKKRRLELKNCENITLNGRVFDKTESYIEE